jgi:hypothetical protein
LSLFLSCSDSILISKKAYLNISNKVKKQNLFILPLELDTTISKYKDLKYDFVEAIDYINDGLLDSSDIGLNFVKQRIILNEEQINQFIQTSDAESTYNNPAGAQCFVPRLAVIFYKNSKIVAYSLVCIHCLRVTSSLNGITEEQMLGMKGGDAFSKICQDLKFSECDHPTLIED